MLIIKCLHWILLTVSSQQFVLTHTRTIYDVCNGEESCGLHISQENHSIFSLSLCIAHIWLSISCIITTGRKVEAENLRWPTSYLLMNIYEVIWIMWFCNNKISFGERSRRETGCEECQQAEEEDSSRVKVGSSGPDEGNTLDLKMNDMKLLNIFEDNFILHGDTLGGFETSLHLICSS